MSALLPFFPALFVLLWSTGFIGARYAMPHAEPFTFLALRFALALLILAPAALLRGKARPTMRQGLAAAVSGALIHGLYLGGVFYAVRHGLSAGVTALVVGLQPILTAILAGAFLGERVRGVQWLGLALGLLGVGLVILPKIGEGAMPPAALAAALIGAAAITLGTVWQKRFGGGVDLVAGTAIQYAGALVPAGLGMLLFETRVVDWTGELVFALLWLTFVLSIGAIFLLLVMIREGAVSRVTSLMYLTPGVTAVMGFLLFGERLETVQLAGLVLAALGVAASTRGGRAPVVRS